MENEIPDLVRTHLINLGISVEESPWTVYAAIAAYNIETLNYKILSFGSGIKCLPDVIINDHSESVVHDSHAEIICRRSFIIFVYKELIELSENKDSENSFFFFDHKLEKYAWKPENKLIFYSSQSGDASIFNNNSNNNCSKRCRISINKALAAGRETDKIGILRTKPGRGDSPFASSMSCSDKIASWNLLGIQGALLTHFVTPIYLDYILLGDNFDQISTDRALKNRTVSIEFEAYLKQKGYKNVSDDLILKKSYNFGFGKNNPALDETSIFWYKGLPRPGRQVLGFKKGSKRPEKCKPYELSLQSPLSRQNILEKYFFLLKPETNNSYFELKCQAYDYQIAKKLLLQHSNFKDWIVRNIIMKEFRQQEFFNN